MPVKRRKRKQLDDYPRHWEDRPVSQERWERHRERLLARTAHYRWARIPTEIIRRWDAERARPAKTIEKLTAGASGCR